MRRLHARTAPSSIVRPRTILAALGLAIGSLLVAGVTIERVRALCPPATEALFETLRPLPAEGRTFASIDAVSLDDRAAGRDVRAGSDDSVEVRGRARDPRAGRTGSAVVFAFENGVNVRAQYGLDARVGAVTPAAGAREADVYDAILLTRSLGRGTHVARLCVVSSDLSGFFDSGLTIEITVV